MKFGLFGINIGPFADPDVAVRVARAAEDAGFESAWTGEHVVLPDPQVPPSPAPPQERFLDPAVALAFLAAHTERLRLGTGIIILPQRNPLVLAKELASVDVLSGGRLLVGVGAGYLESEFAALGAPFAERGARTDEYLEAMVALWTQEKPSFRGPSVSFSGIDAQPRPVQKPHPPVVVGGHSPPAFRRAVRYGHGWYGFLRDTATTERDLQGLADAAAAVERPDALGALEISITPPPRLDRDGAERYRDLGVHRLTLLPTDRSPDGLLRFVDETAERLVRTLA